MDIAWFRDLSVTILGFAATIVFIVSGIVLLRLYSAIKGVIDEVKAASMVAHDTATRLQEGMRPIFAIFETIQDMRAGHGRRSTRHHR